MINSIRFRTTLFYSLSLLVSLSVFSFFIYNKIKTAIYEYIDEILFLKAESIVDSIEGRFANINSIECSNLIICDKNFNEIVINVINSHIKDPTLNSLSVRVLDLKGKPLLSSVNFPDYLYDTPISNIEGILSGNAYYQTITVEDGEDLVDYRTYTTPLRINSSSIYIIQVLRPLTQSKFTLNTMFKYIMIFIPVVIFITAFFGMLIVKVAIYPLNYITHTINEIIKKENIKVRVKLPQNKDEIWEVVVLFNEMLDRLEKIFMSQKNFIYDASHSLKTPLTIIKGEIDVVLKKVRTAEEYIEVLKNILEEIEKLISLVENFITIAKIHNFENRYLAEVVLLSDIINEAVENVKKLADIKRIKLDISGDYESIRIKADRSIITRAISNIIENSIKYSREGSDVSINVTRSDSEVIISVSDKGIGIPEDELNKVFDKFFRASNAKEIYGSGLGLSIAKTAIESSGGRITISSTIGKGTCVNIYLKIEN